MKIFQNYHLRIRAHNPVLSGYLYIGYNDLMLKGKNLLDYANLFSPNQYESNDKK